MEFYLKLIFIQLYVSNKDTLCYAPSFFHEFPFIFSFSRNCGLHIISRPAQKENPAVPDFLTSQLLLITIQKKSSQTFSFHISAISSGKGFFHGTKNKTISAHNCCRRHAFCGAAAAFCRSDLCSTAGRPGTAHSGRRHSGTIYQCAYDRAGKTAEAPVLQGQKTALG